MKFSSNTLFLAILIALTTTCGCKCGSNTVNNIPRTGKIKVKPVDDLARNFLYCRYEVTGAPNQGQPAIKVGEFICLKCPAGKTICDNFSEIEMGDGQVYPVKAKDNGLACTSCPKGTDNPPGYPFEEE